MQMRKICNIYQQHFPALHVIIMTEEEEEKEEGKKPSATSSCMQAEKKRQIVREKTNTIHAPETVVVKSEPLIKR